MKNQTFGIEIETTGLGRERTAQVIAELFGTTARYIGRHLGDWHIPMPDGRKWVVERDGSVTDPSAEVVSPVCRWDDIPMVQEVVRALRQAGAKADASCGIHIHVGLGEHTPQSLRRLTNIVNAKEDLLTQALGISPSRRRQWCKPVDPAFLAELNRRKPATMDALAQLWYKTNNPTTSDWRDCASSHYDHSRYHLLNLHAAFSPNAPRTPLSSAPSTAHSTRAKSKPTSSFASPFPIRRSPPRPPARRAPSQTTRNTPSAAGSCAWASSAGI